MQRSYGDFEGTATIAVSQNSGADFAIAFTYMISDDAKTALRTVLDPIIDRLATLV